PSPGGYYSYDLAGWHVIVLNANCAANVARQTPSNPDGCSGDSVQGKWLKADLAAHTTQCMIAMWHEPRFFSVAVPDVTMPGNLPASSDSTMDGMWQILQNAGVDAVVTGHWNDYERFPRLSLPQGSAVGPGTTPPTTAPTTATTSPTSGPGPTTTSAVPGAGQSGYWMVGADGRVYPFGAAQGMGDAPPSAGAEAVDIEPTPARDGYWVVDSAGAVTAREIGRAHV